MEPASCSSYLTFEHERHIYKLEPRGIVLPSVSEILRPLVDLSKIPAARLEFARERGTAVHKACELFDRGNLDEDDLDEQLVPYLNGWKEFVKCWTPKWTAIEEPDYHRTLMYAGTPDRRAIVFKGRKATRITIDVKATYELSPAVQVQLSGYDLMDHEGPADELWSVRLKNDGTYEKTVHPAAHSTFLSCLNIFNWKKKNA